MTTAIEGDASVLLAEYRSLKDEQIARIGFRDNLVYVTLGVVVTAYALSSDSPSYLPGALIVPVACFALGWTYLVNDYIISEIGRYLREHLAASLSEFNQIADAALPAIEWERYHRNDKRRQSRKRIQLLVDEVTFIMPGAVGLFAVILRAPELPRVVVVLAIAEVALLALLAWQIALYTWPRRQAQPMRKEQQ